MCNTTILDLLIINPEKQRKVENILKAALPSPDAVPERGREACVPL